ncbi:Usp17le [Symbiodinium sp. KB8]|nr:Usp17le [Symbiodinium sp. KB8]
MLHPQPSHLAFLLSFQHRHIFATMADGLFGAGEQAETVKKAERRVKLCPWDSVAAQLLEPYGESAFDSLTLDKLWSAASRGNRKARYHSHLCAAQEEDAWHVGAGISQTAASLLAAIKNFRSKDMQQLIKPDLYTKVEEEINTLEPTLKVLNLGRGSQTQQDTGSFRETKKRKIGDAPAEMPTAADMAKAARALHAWLKQERSPFRSLLFSLSGSNSYYTAHVAETVARAAIAQKPMTADHFEEAMQARMGKTPATTSSPGTAATSTNLGSSCFINAGLQALLEVPGLRGLLTRENGQTEWALIQVLDSVTTSTSPLVPRQITDLYYNNRQEDAAEFLVRLLGDCCGAHVRFQGQEQPRFCCTYCDFSRPLQPEPFLTMQLPLKSDRLLVSVQEALDSYLQQQTLQDDVLHWTCRNAACLMAGKAGDPPFHTTEVKTWPEVLLLSLNRWDRVHGLLDHDIYCNESLSNDGAQYQLKAVVTHIGQTAASGHYVCYRACPEGFRKFDDTRISTLPGQSTSFVTSAQEKVYILLYVKISEDAEAVAARLPSRVVDIDSSSDSDVIMIADTEKPQKEDSKPTPDRDELELLLEAELEEFYKQYEKDEVQSKKRRITTGNTPPLSRFSSEEHRHLREAINEAASVKQLLATLAKTVPRLTIVDKKSDGYVGRSTLRGWMQHPDRFDKAMASSMRATDARKRQAPVGSVRQSLTPEDSTTVHEALQVATSISDFQRQLTQNLPGFSATDATAPNYIPRSTLYTWFARPAVTTSFDPRCTGLSKDFDNIFTVAMKKPAQHKFPQPETPSDEWTKVEALVLQPTEALCKPCCDVDAETLLEDLDDLAVVDIKVEYKSRRGGNASLRAFTWLMSNNSTYAFWVNEHARQLQQIDRSPGWRDLFTADLLLNSPGIEVAARPWLYPLPSFADTDLPARLKALSWITSNQKPSIRASFLRKVLSRCIDYSRDFKLHALLYDTCMARSISAIISVANKAQIEPEYAAENFDAFEGFWMVQIRRLEDLCRQIFEKTQDMTKALPNIFFTIAPAEWRFVLPDGLIFDETLLANHLLNKAANLSKIGIQRVHHCSFRYEFQSRGTLHIHALLWADLLPGWQAEDVNGRSGEKHSAFLQLLEDVFKCRADVQAGDGSHILLRYVAGYVAKASDALQFQAKQSNDVDSTWRQTYRLLCKKAPTEQEIIMEFAGLSMVKHSFSGDSVFPPIPGSTSTNASRRLYELYQLRLRQEHPSIEDVASLSFLQWLRSYQLTEDGKLRLRNKAGPAKNKICCIGVKFPFELLDIYVGAWAACCLPGMTEERLLPDVPAEAWATDEVIRRRSFRAPKNCEHLKAVFLIEPELVLRGLNADRITTFKAKVEASNLLLLHIRDGKEDPGFWTAKNLPGLPQRTWSPEQQQVLDFVERGISITDAASLQDSTRILQISGSPGTIKTEVVIGAAEMALKDDCKVLIAGPIGLLIAMYKLRLPSTDNLTMETIHSAFKVTREADQAYIPPGRLRRYDVIILDEVSQIDEEVWEQLKIALRELAPGPLVIFVGDFQQLQPLRGMPRLQMDLDREAEAGKVVHIKLQHHNRARSIDPAMLDFLTQVRCEQPSRACLEAFFRGRIWPSEPTAACRRAIEREAITGKPFTFLTVTNKAAQALNAARVALEYPAIAQQLRDGGGIPTETGTILLAPDMHVRLTHNVSKDEGFVNGNIGRVRLVLRKDVFILETPQRTSVLVYPIMVRGQKYLPATYGYATTMRRAQGATLDDVALHFDRKMPDRGYAYVGVSRVKTRSNVFLLGKIRRTDWLPVGGPMDGEQTWPSGMSDSTDGEEPESSDMESSSVQDPSSDDFGAFDEIDEPSSDDFVFRA